MIYEKELSDKIINCAFVVHKNLGYGFLEKVYENSLKLELEEAGLKVKQQVGLDVFYKNKIVGEFRADLVVEDKIVLELKAERRLNQEHLTQLINYLKVSKIRLGYLINFGKNRLEFKRIIV